MGQKYWNLPSKKTTKGEGGVMKSEKWAVVVYGRPPKTSFIGSVYPLFYSYEKGCGLNGRIINKWLTFPKLSISKIHSLSHR